MRSISLSHSLFWLVAVGAAAAASNACNDPLSLPPVQFENRVDTVTIYALQGTALALPSAYDIVGGRPARTDRAEAFDFAFDVDGTGQPTLLAATALGLNQSSALVRSSLPFDSILEAPQEGFDDDSVFVLTAGMVLIGRSRGSNVQCSLLGTLPRYGKFRVLEVDAPQRLVRLQALVNRNCGYRSLEPGFPEN